MLVGAASKYYFDTLKDKEMRLEEIVPAVKKSTYINERIRYLIRQWDGTNFASVMPGNVGKSPTKCLQLMFKQLQDVEVSLTD